jgi:hypothetical protein
MYVCMYVCMNYYRSHCRIWGPGKHLQVPCPHHTFLNPPQLQQVCTVYTYVCIYCMYLYISLSKVMYVCMYVMYVCM